MTTDNIHLTSKLTALRPMLLRHITKQVSPQILARFSVDDIAQETMVRAIGAMDTFEYRGDAQLTSWLIRIANNVVVSQIRKRAESASESMAAWLLDSGAITGSAELRAKEEREIIRNRIEMLTQEHQKIVELRYVKGCSFDEIGDCLGTNAAVARGRHRNALRALCRELEAIHWQ
ncbi:MAG: RNA polymerase sigma factor [Fuerstiella sp.]